MAEPVTMIASAPQLAASLAEVSTVMFGSTETVFYIATVYFSGTKVRRLGGALVIALACCVLSAALACLLCKFM